MLLYKENTTSFSPLKDLHRRQMISQSHNTKLVCVCVCNGVAGQQTQAADHYTNPEQGAIIAIGEYNQVLCLSLL